MNHRPPPLLATTVVVLLVALWGYLRLIAFADTFVPLTYVIPLLVGAWTCRRWHVWGMAAIFIAFTFLKAGALNNDGSPLVWGERLFVSATFFNIVIGAGIVHLLIRYRERLAEKTATVLAQNAELEAQAEELMQQNEEIRAQSEELAQQNEEINAQAEELARQNEELHQSNDRLGIREQLLQGLLESSRGSDENALTTLCRNALAILGAPANHVALLERHGEGLLQVSAQAATAGLGDLPAAWPLERALAGLVLANDRTAYVSDLDTQPELSAPFPAGGAIRSLLVTPLRIEGTPAGVLAVTSAGPAHWTDEQFQLIEWIATMCGHFTKSIRSRAALQERTRQLESASHAKDEFLAMLSHELRTPLTPVLAAAGVLATDPRLPEEAREDLAMIRRNVTIQSRLIDDLLDLTRIERRKLDLNVQPCVPAALLRDAATIVGPDLDARGQRVTVHCALPEKWRIPGDPARLQQVLWNLLQNATKFSPPQSHIQLTARLLPGETARIELAVEDEGPGVPAAECERIFHPFEQIRNGRRIGRDSGLGLGLAIARAIVELHDGTLQVGPGAGGRGARFTANLPLVPAGETAPPGHPAVEPAVPEALSILLVEDHTDTGRVISQLLKGAGHDVIHATTATEALERFRRSRFNLIISDIGLPDESGLVLMKKLRALQPGLAGICMTGYGMESDQQACFAAGFGEHLAKPVDVQRLHAAINRAARQPERLSGV